MACNLSLNASNGEKSILFKKIAKVSNNIDVAIDAYYFTKTEEFKREYGDWENGEVPKEFLDLNGEPLYETFSDKDYMQDIDYSEIELEAKTDMYKKLMEEIPSVLSKIEKNIDSLKRTGKNGELIKKLEYIKPLLMTGDVNTGIPKFIESARTHIISLRNRAEARTDIKDIRRTYKDAKSYEMVLDILDALQIDSESREIFSEDLFKGGAQIRSDLAELESMYFNAASKHLVDGLHEQDKSWSKDDIRKWLSSSPRDVKYTEKLLEAMVDSQDKLLASVGNLVGNQEHAIRREKIDFNNELSNLVDSVIDEAGSSNSDKVFSPIIHTKANGELHILDISAEDTKGKNLESDEQFRKVQEIKRTNPKLMEFLVFYTDTMTKLNSGIPDRAVLGTRLPSVLKDSLERMQGKSIKENSKQIWDETGKAILRSNLDMEKGMINDASGKPIDQIPTFYTQKYDSVDFEDTYNEKYKELIEGGMEDNEAGVSASTYAEKVATDKMAKLITKDLSHSLQAFHAMAINFSKKNEILDLLESAKDVVESKRRRYVKIDKAGRTVTTKDHLGNVIPETILGPESRAAETLNTFLQMHVYGQKETDLGYFDLLGKKFDTNKVLRQINKKTSLVQMALNFLASSANIAVGEYNNSLEALAGEYTSGKSYKKAGKIYRQGIGDVMADIGSRKSNSLVNQINDHYQILGDYNPSNVKVNENSKFKRLFKTNMLFFMQESGEHFLQMRMGMSVLDHIKTFDKNGKETGTLLDAHKKGDGKISIENTFIEGKDGKIVPYDVSQQNRVTNKISAVLRKVHGNYSAQTATAAKQDARTAMILKYRDWAYEGLVRRFGGKQTYVNLEQDATGFYKDGFNTMWKLKDDLKTLNFQLIKEDWQNLTPNERANVKRLVAEAATIVSLIASAALLSHAGKGMEDDYDSDKLTDRLALGGFNYLVYMTNRIKTEIFAYVNPVEALRLFQSPAASTTLIENTIKLLGQFMDPTEIRETGRQRGDYEIFIKASKLVPAYKNLSRLNPEGIKDSGVFYIF